jgi:hypothetical protein
MVVFIFKVLVHQKNQQNGVQEILSHKIKKKYQELRWKTLKVSRTRLRAINLQTHTQQPRREKKKKSRRERKKKAATLSKITKPHEHHLI